MASPPTGATSVSTTQCLQSHSVWSLSNIFCGVPNTSTTVAGSRQEPTEWVQTAQHGFSFFHGVVPVWNSLPDRVITCASQLGFKRSLRTHLFQTNY